MIDGYGHLGCCALFVITDVSDVESVPSANLNVHGTVKGPDSRALEGFIVFDDILGGSPPERQQTATNAKGEFTFSNSGQLLRFENPRYQPLALPIETGSVISVKLEDAKQSDWRVPSCEHEGDSADKVGFSVLFTLPATMESRRFDDDGLQSYFIIPHGGDPAAAELTVTNRPDQSPPSDVFLDSIWFEQRWIKDSAGVVVGMDSRGRFQGGTNWRTAAFFGHDYANIVGRAESSRTPLTGSLTRHASQDRDSRTSALVGASLEKCRHLLPVVLLV